MRYHVHLFIWNPFIEVKRYCKCLEIEPFEGMMPLAAFAPPGLHMYLSSRKRRDAPAKRVR